MKNAFLLPLLFLVIACSNDSNPENGLPKETQTGANTFGCLINGKLYKPRCEKPSVAFPQWGMVVWGSPSSYNYTEIEVRDLKSEFGFNLLLHIESMNSVGINTTTIDESNGLSGIDGLQNNYLHCTIYDKVTSNYKKYISYQNSGTINITKLGYASNNPNNGFIISGTFSGNLRNIDNPNEEIKITKGRFDINTMSCIYKEFP
jgi:hypothetical protein